MRTVPLKTYWGCIKLLLKHHELLPYTSPNVVVDAMALLVLVQSPLEYSARTGQKSIRSDEPPNVGAEKYLEQNGLWHFSLVCKASDFLLELSRQRSSLV